jgi:hypothetical protein
MQEPKKVEYDINGILKREKKRRLCSLFKMFSRIFIEKIYKMGGLEGSVYIGRTVPKG